jgi:hypothetical protein
MELYHFFCSALAGVGIQNYHLNLTFLNETMIPGCFVHSRKVRSGYLMQARDSISPNQFSAHRKTPVEKSSAGIIQLFAMRSIRRIFSRVLTRIHAVCTPIKTIAIY